MPSIGKPTFASPAKSLPAAGPEKRLRAAGEVHGQQISREVRGRAPSVGQAGIRPAGKRSIKRALQQQPMVKATKPRTDRKLSERVCQILYTNMRALTALSVLRASGLRRPHFSTASAFFAFPPRPRPRPPEAWGTAPSDCSSVDFALNWPLAFNSRMAFLYE